MFSVDEDDQGGTEETVKVDCGPVVFKLCERANQLPDLYVVVDGWIRMVSVGGSAEVSSSAPANIRSA